MQMHRTSKTYRVNMTAEFCLYDLVSYQASVEVVNEQNSIVELVSVQMIGQLKRRSLLVMEYMRIYYGKLTCSTMIQM